MYISLGQKTVIIDSSVVGIFDLDATTVSSKTREFLRKAQENGEVTAATDDLPKAFVVCAPALRRAGAERKKRVYIVRYMPQTIKKQLGI